MVNPKPGKYYMKTYNKETDEEEWIELDNEHFFVKDCKTKEYQKQLKEILDE